MVHSLCWRRIRRRDQSVDRGDREGVEGFGMPNIGIPNPFFIEAQYCVYSLFDRSRMRLLN